MTVTTTTTTITTHAVTHLEELGETACWGYCDQLDDQSLDDILPQPTVYKLL